MVEITKLDMKKITKSLDSIAKSLDKISNKLEAESPQFEEYDSTIHGSIIGYVDVECPNCSRHRVEKYSTNIHICEKCHWCIERQDYIYDKYL